MFVDRRDAGKKLAQALSAYKDEPVVVYALPRGGVVLGVEVAKALAAPLDLIVVRKVGHPLQPEYAIAAVAEDGYVVTNPAEVESVDQDWLKGAIASELKEAQRRRDTFLQGRHSIPVKDKTAILVDDGLATGFTMIAAVHTARKRHPQKVVVAVPVAAAETVEKLHSIVDDIVVLHIPHWLGAIGSFYSEFSQVSDQEVIALMSSFPPAAEVTQKRTTS